MQPMLCAVGRSCHWDFLLFRFLIGAFTTSRVVRIVLCRMVVSVHVICASKGIIINKYVFSGTVDTVKSAEVGSVLPGPNKSLVLTGYSCSK